jgi:DUF438 domain-containing protein
LDKIEQLTQLFLRLDSGEKPENLRQEARSFLSQISPRDVALAEQSLMQAGADVSKLRSRCVQHISLLPDQVTRIRTMLPSNHIVRIILAEHEMMLCFLADLEQVNAQIQKMPYCAPTSLELRKLSHIVSHLITAGDHNYREDEIIFPELERRGYYGPPEILKIEHLHLFVCNWIMNFEVVNPL